MDEDWDADEVKPQKPSKLKQKFENDDWDEWDENPKKTELEREEELFRKHEEDETKEIRNSIKRKLQIPIENDEPIKKRLKVSEIFRDSDSKEASPENDAEINTLAQLESIRISRDQLKSWVFMPFFGTRIPGFFVKVNIGTKNNEPVYRIAQIVGVVENGPTYQIEELKVNKRLRLSICGSEKSFRISFISNQPFSAEEFDVLMKQHQKISKPKPKVSEIEEKIEDYEFCFSYQLTSKDIDKMVEEKSKVDKIPKNYAVFKKKLANDLELAQIEKNEEKINDLLKEIEIANEEFEKISKKNTDRLENPEEYHQKMIREQDKREKLIEQEVQADKDNDDDPFTRRKTAPIMVQFVNSSTLKQESKQRILEMRNNRNKTTSGPKKVAQVAPPLPEIQPTVDLCKLHDFDLDISLEI